MATILFQAAGAALFGAFGPVGAILGQAAGALAGSLVDRALLGGKGTVRGAALSGARIPGADEGTGIARVYGTMRVAGTLIWATRFEETVTSERQGGKMAGPKVESYRYAANFALGLCEGEIAGIRRVWADGREIDLTEIEMRVHRGTRDQLPDPLIEAKQGAGAAPAYRGLAYVVFERLPLDGFGNRIPVMQFEVVRPVGRLERDLRAVTIIPAATEHGYDPQVVTAEDGPGGERRLNRNVLFAGSDWSASLDELQALCPNLEAVALAVAWFGDDLRADTCRIMPGVETRTRPGESRPWSVSGLTRTDARLVSEAGGGPAFGGTPNDAGVIAAIRDIRTRGLKVFLYPFVLMDVPAGNGLPDPYGAAEQAAYPWRGRITCHPATGRPGSPDATAAIDAAVAAFSGAAAPGDFTVAGDAVGYAGGDFGYRRMILHNAHLAAAAGGVDGLIVGSEMIGLTHLRNGAGAFPFVDQLRDLAGAVKAIVGAETAVTYAADWSEYFGYQPQDGSGDVFYHLDPLWADAAIDAVGIDNYMPLSDWRDGDRIAGNPDGFVGATDPAGLAAAIASGEGFDWYYASDADRQARLRSPIADGAAGKPWVFRPKDIASWWANPHYERRGGVELAAPTVWEPAAKPVWFTELGCPAVEKGANQPNVFPDPKSSENALPYFSNGARSDAAQRRFLEAHLAHWTAGAAPGGMVDPDRIFAWTWDARPYPAFPGDAALWSDGPNWTTGHWLNGRLGAGTAADIIAALLADHGFQEVVVDAVDRDLSGYVQAEPASARQMLEPLLEALAIDAAEEGDRLVFRARMTAAAAPIPIETLAEPEDGARIVETIAEEDERASEVALDHFDPANAYQAASAGSRRLSAGNRRQTRLALPAALDEALARDAADRWLRDHWASRRTVSFALPAAACGPMPGDVVTLSAAALGETGAAGPYRITRIEDGLRRQVTAVGWSGAGGAPALPAPRPSTPGAAAQGFAPLLVFLDLPVLKGTTVEDFAMAAAFARPWRPIALSSAADGETFRRRVVLDAPARIGALAAPLAPGAVAGRFDPNVVLEVDLYFGAFASASERAVLDGANALAVAADNGAFEVLQFGSAEEIAPGRFRLTHCLRGQAGTEDAMRAGASIGARVLALDTAVRPLGLTADEAGRAEGYVAEAVGLVTAPRPAATFTGGLRALTPLAPVHLAAERLEGGDVAISWIRRGRLDADDWEAAEIPLDEADERYRLDILDGSTVRRSVTILGAPAYRYAAADISADFGAVPTNLSVRVRQLGRKVAEGLAATAELAL